MEKQSRETLTREFMEMVRAKIITGNLTVADIEHYTSLGVDINCQDIYKESVLHTICRSKYTRPEIIKALIKAGADINLKERSFGRIPLHCAAQQGTHLVIMALIDAGASVNARDLYKYTPLMYMTKRSRVRRYIIQAVAGPSFLRPFKKNQRNNIDRFENVIKDYCEKKI